MIWSAAWWRGAAERALKTFAQSLLAVLGVGGLGVLDIDWLGALSVAGVATLASLLTSILNADFTAGVEPRRAAVEVELDPMAVSPETRAIIEDQRRP